MDKLIIVTHPGHLNGEIEICKELFDLWNVNEDADYHEAGDRGADIEVIVGRAVPGKVA